MPGIQTGRLGHNGWLTGHGRCGETGGSRWAAGSPRGLLPPTCSGRPCVPQARPSHAPVASPACPRMPGAPQLLQGQTPFFSSCSRRFPPRQPLPSTSRQPAPSCISAPAKHPPLLTAPPSANPTAAGRAPSGAADPPTRPSSAMPAARATGALWVACVAVGRVEQRLVFQPIRQRRAAGRPPWLAYRAAALPAGGLLPRCCCCCRQPCRLPTTLLPCRRTNQLGPAIPSAQRKRQAQNCSGQAKAHSGQPAAKRLAVA